MIIYFFSIFYFDPGVIWGRFRHRKPISFDRNIEFLLKNSCSIFYFDPRVIWGRFRHRKSILFDRNIEILWKMICFDPQIDLLIEKSIFRRKKNANRNRIWTGTGRRFKQILLWEAIFLIVNAQSGALF